MSHEKTTSPTTSHAPRPAVAGTDPAAHLQVGDVVWLSQHDGTRQAGVWTLAPDGRPALYADGQFINPAGAAGWEVHRGEVIDQGERLMLVHPDTLTEVDDDGRESIDADTYPPTWVDKYQPPTARELAQDRLEQALADLGEARAELRSWQVYGANAPVDPDTAHTRHQQAQADLAAARADLDALNDTPPPTTGPASTTAADTGTGTSPGAASITGHTAPATAREDLDCIDCGAPADVEALQIDPDNQLRADTPACREHANPYLDQATDTVWLTTDTPTDEHADQLVDDLTYDLADDLGDDAGLVDDLGL